MPPKFTSTPWVEDLTPAPDGLTTLFSTSRDYVPGTTSLWVNGIRKRADWDDGYDEEPPRGIRTREAPWFGDTLQIQYAPTS